MSRPFIFRINAAELFTEIQALNSDQKAAFITQFSTDLLTLIGTSDYSKKVIDETLQLIEKRSVSGKLGGRPKSETKAKVKQGLSKAKANTKQEVEVEVEVEVEIKEEKNKRFVPPSVPEVDAYMKEINFKGSGDNFVNHYTANGWKVGGKSPMKDWRAAVRTWHGKDKKSNPQQSLSVGYVYGRDPKPAFGTPEYKIWQQEYARACQ